MAALLDEVMGTSAWLAGHMALAVNISIDFRRMIPIGTVVWLEGWVDSVEGRKVRTLGRLTDSHGNVFSEGKGLFLQFHRENFAGLVKIGARSIHQKKSKSEATS